MDKPGGYATPAGQPQQATRPQSWPAPWLLQFLPPSLKGSTRCPSAFFEPDQINTKGCLGTRRSQRAYCSTVTQKSRRRGEWMRGLGVCRVPHETVPARTFLTWLKLPLVLVFLGTLAILALRAFPRSREKAHKS